MKLKLLSLIVLSILSSVSILFAQEVEKSFVPYYIENGNVLNFERIGAKMEAKAIGFGYGGVNTYLTVFNSKNSSVRFTKNETLKFIIKIDEGTDVLELISIVKADVVKKKKTYRRFVQGGNSMVGTKDMSKYFIIPKLREIANNLYEIIIDEEFKPGEYAFQPIYKGVEATNINSSSGSVRIYCFGIDN
ncbi:MAG: hypothetical protein COC06_00160 [Bacteroidales bacterium]|nr:MAG: hypothetical protein COC06_00160 [Bacteroidales bacterium]